MVEVLLKAKEQSAQIKKMRNVIDDINLKTDIDAIGETVDKIISTIEKTPKKLKNVESFFDYYLPMTLKILKRYDEIENQRLSSSESKTFMEQARKTIKEVRKAFDKQLSNLYQNEIVDTDAEMKVLDMMLKSEGLNTDGISLEDK